MIHATMSLLRVALRRIFNRRLSCVICPLSSSLSDFTNACVFIHRQHELHRKPLRDSSLARSFFTETRLPDLPKHHPEKGKLIYIGTLSETIKYVKIFSLSTSAMGLLAQPLLYRKISSLPPALAVGISSFLGFSVLVMPLLLHLVTKRYINDIYYNADTDQFTASCYTLFLRRREYKFTANDVKVHEIPRLFSTLKVSGTPLYIDQMLFTDREAGIHLLGYDKPIDFEIHADDLDDDDDVIDDQSKKK